jgi:chalcone synthase
VGCLVGQALFGDGAAIIGSDPDTLIEKPILQLVSAAQVTILDSVQAIEDHVGEMELSIHLSEDAHKLITINVDAALQ